jgi:hypothetical protein
LQQRCCCVYVRVRICSVCVRLSQNALPHAAQTTAMQKARTPARACECVCARTCSACKFECVLFVTGVHTHSQSRALPRMQPSRRAHLTHFAHATGRPNQRVGAHVQPSDWYGPLALCGRGAGRWREYGGSTAVVPLLCSHLFGDDTVPRLVS